MGKSTLKSKTVNKIHITDKPDASLPTFDDIYKSVIHILLNGTKKQQNKVWKQLNEGEGDWVWMKMKVITDAYSYADAKGKEEFSLIAIDRHLKTKFAVQGKDFTDDETGIKYRQYSLQNGLIWRIPYATEGMDKYACDKALNKKFLGDYIEMHSVDELTLIPLDTPEKVNDYNSGGHYYQNHPLYKDTKPIVIKLKQEKEEISSQI